MIFLVISSFRLTDEIWLMVWRKRAINAEDFAELAIIENRSNKSPEQMLRALNKWRNGRDSNPRPLRDRQVF